MKPLLFEDRDSSSPHLLLLRSVSLASDRLREKKEKQIKEILSKPNIFCLT